MSDLIYTVFMRGIFIPYIQAAATQLLSAARNGDIATVRRLVIEGHVDVNVTDEVGVSSPCLAKLHWRPHTTVVGYCWCLSILCHGPMQPVTHFNGRTFQ